MVCGCILDDQGLSQLHNAVQRRSPPKQIEERIRYVERLATAAGLGGHLPSASQGDDHAHTPSPSPPPPSSAQRHAPLRRAADSDAQAVGQQKSAKRVVDATATATAGTHSSSKIRDVPEIQLIQRHAACTHGTSRVEPPSAARVPSSSWQPQRTPALSPVPEALGSSSGSPSPGTTALSEDTSRLPGVLATTGGDSDAPMALSQPGRVFDRRITVWLATLNMPQYTQVLQRAGFRSLRQVAYQAADMLPKLDAIPRNHMEFLVEAAATLRMKLQAQDRQRAAKAHAETAAITSDAMPSDAMPSDATTPDAMASGTVTSTTSTSDVTATTRGGSGRGSCASGVHGTVPSVASSPAIALPAPAAAPIPHPEREAGTEAVHTVHSSRDKTADVSTIATATASPLVDMSTLSELPAHLAHRPQGPLTPSMLDSLLGPAPCLLNHLPAAPANAPILDGSASTVGATSHRLGHSNSSHNSQLSNSNTNSSNLSSDTMGTEAAPRGGEGATTRSPVDREPLCDQATPESRDARREAGPSEPIDAAQFMAQSVASSTRDAHVRRSSLLSPTAGSAVSIWLQSQHLGQYVSQFQACGFRNLNQLAQVDQDTLAQMGIDAKDYRRVLRATSALRAGRLMTV